MSDWDSLRRKMPLWFSEAKLGIFIHWGAYSVPGWAEPTAQLGEISTDEYWFTHNPYAEWYFNTIRIEGSPAQKYHNKNWDGIPYDKFLDLWKVDDFHVEELMKLFKDAGAKYIVLTTKHHDGITLWDAPETQTRNTVHRGPHRDLVSLYSNAAKKEGIKFGAYYSGGLDWWKRPGPPMLDNSTVHETGRPKDSGYASYALEHLRDLVERYNPDILWNDINWPDAGKNFGHKESLGDFFEEFYRKNPEGLVNDRWHVEHADYLTSEYVSDLENESKGPWENCRGLGLSFGFNRNEGPQHGRNYREIIQLVIEFAARGGRLLLGVGPKADGSLPEWQTQILRQLSGWMTRNSDIVSSINGSAEIDFSNPDNVWVHIGAGNSGTYLFIDGGNNHEYSLTLKREFEVIDQPGSFIQITGDSIRISTDESSDGPIILKIIT